MNFHRHIRTKYHEFVRDSCEEQNCKLHLQHLPRSLLTILHTDSSQFRQLFSLKEKPLSDYLVFLNAQDLTLIVLELKSGRADVSEASKQIGNGARVAEQIVVSKHIGKFLPLLLYHHISSIERKVIGRSKVLFRGKPFLITARRCQSHLKRIIEELP